MLASARRFYDKDPPCADNCRRTAVAGARNADLAGIQRNGAFVDQSWITSTRGARAFAAG
jgi:hypothetical protein